MKFLTMKNTGHLPYKSNLWLKVESTYPLCAKKEEYVWVIFVNRITGGMARLCLYNMTAGKEVIDTYLIMDMLKIFYAYMIMFGDDFRSNIHISRKECEEHISITDRKIKEQKARVLSLKSELPPFDSEALSDLLWEVSQIFDREKKQLEFLIKYDELINQLTKLKKAIPVQVFMTFYQDIYSYIDVMKIIEARVTRKLDEDPHYISLVVNEKIYKSLHELIEEQKARLERFRFYKNLPLVNKMIEQDFSERILDEYKPIVKHLASV